MPVGQLQYFRSKVDGKLHPCAVCATDTSDEPKPLIVEVSPGALGNLPGAVELTEQIAGIAARHNQSCIVLRPTGRGSGSVYQNYGEIDVLEAIEHVASNYAIDRDRITITGSSMGGAATWYLISHYPDLFAGAAPFCGYCDYRLWEKPGGLTFHMHEWEIPSWRSRSAAFLIENLSHTPVWIIHGEWDRGVGGGVPVEHSRQMTQLMGARGYRHKYTEVPKTGHGCRLPEIWEEVILWLLKQRKQRFPDHVSLATYNLRHNQSYWVMVDQLSHYGERGAVNAHFVKDSHLVVHTENIRTFSLGPIQKNEPVDVTIDGQEFELMNLKSPESVSTKPLKEFGRMAILISPLRSVTGHRVPSVISFSMGLSLSPARLGQRKRHFLTNGLLRTRSDTIAVETGESIAVASWEITLSNSLSALTLNSQKISCKRTTCSYTAFMILTPSYRNLKVSCHLALKARQSTYPINRTRRMGQQFLPYFLIP